MKKKLFHSFLFAVTILTGSALVACGDAVQELENNVENQDETVTETTVGENCTLFSTGDDGTRTSLDTERRFYWTEGDQIYVNTTGDTYKKTSESRLKTGDREADFVLSGVKLTAKKCSLMYIGNGMNSTDTEVSADNLKVKIEETQTQSAWGDRAHVGPSGDCGAAEAMKNETTGKYSFKLNHKAAYLVFQPYKDVTITRTWTLMKIEIITDGTTTLAGTYPFGTGELDVDNATTTSNTVTLNCGTAGFELDHAASIGKSVFAVIQPGTHAITFRYTIKPEIMVNGVVGGTFTIEMPIASRTYNIGGVTTIKHQLGAEMYSPYLFHLWDAEQPCWKDQAVENVPYYVNHKNPAANYPKNAETAPDRWYNTETNAPEQAKNSCKELPNVNAMTWYVLKGDPRWETNYPWFITGSGGAHIYTYGAWFLKWDNLPDKPTTYTKRDCPQTPLGEDGHYTQLSADKYTVSTNDYKTKGRPSNTEIENYFFLPAIPHILSDGRLGDGRDDIHGCYWSSSPRPGAGDLESYSLGFTSNLVSPLNRNGRNQGRIVAPSWFE